MCGRYALSLRPSQVRQRLQDENMPVDESPDDDDETIRQSYNFAPGYHGLVYRADVPDSGAKKVTESEAQLDEGKDAVEELATQIDGSITKETRYKLQAMKWGLIPFWTKRQPDYGSMMRTINCRDDSLANAGGMWNTMKQKKRCIVVCEGFYEWQKKDNGRTKIPHFIKRKDGQMMCFAGLWDCVKYEGHEEKLYTYSIITTDSNKQISWLHDRMPVILKPGSDAIRTWLDPGRAEWSKELQSLLKPFSGELDCYPVDQAVGKVGNNSPSFVVPVDSKENKKNIANFFGAQKKEAQGKIEEKQIAKTEEEVLNDGGKIKKEEGEDRATETKIESSESNAPLPKPKEEPEEELVSGVKRELSDDESSTVQTPAKSQKLTGSQQDRNDQASSPQKAVGSGRKVRSATSNGNIAKTPVKASDGSKKITSFFGK